MAKKLRYKIEYSNRETEILEGETFMDIYNVFKEKAEKEGLSVSYEIV